MELHSVAASRSAPGYSVTVSPLPRGLAVGLWGAVLHLVWGSELDSG